MVALVTIIIIINQWEVHSRGGQCSRVIHECLNYFQQVSRTLDRRRSFSEILKLEKENKKVVEKIGEKSKNIRKMKPKM